MDSSQIIEYIKHPEQIGAADLAVLEQLTNSYPYCQTSQLLHAKCLHNQDNPRYGAQIKLAAAYAGNRGLLKQLIEKREPIISIIEEDEATNVKVTVGEIQPIAITEKLEKPLEPVVQFSPEVMQRTKLIDIIRSRLAEIPDEPEADYLMAAPDKKHEPKIEKAGIEEHSLPVSIKSAGNKPSESNAILIDRFIREEPRLSPPRREFFNPVDMAKVSSMDREDLVSETLARIFVQQGDIAKAIKIYERLCLNFPGKSSYFADQIENLRRNLK